MPIVNRRQTLTGVVAGLGIPVLAGCGDDGTTAADPYGSSAPATPKSSPTPATPPTSTAPGTPSGDGLVAAADVPVGGGVVLAGDELVVTQPTDGEFKAFSAICTHQGCLVGSVTDEEIVCPCHASHFSITDGSVTSGPAGAPLAAVAVTVRDGQVVAQ